MKQTTVMTGEGSFLYTCTVYIYENKVFFSYGLPLFFQASICDLL